MGGSNICWNVMIGHVGPGVFVTALGLVGFIQCINKNFTAQKRQLTLFYLTAFFAPIGYFSEFMFSTRIGMENIHHFIIHTLVGLDALLIYLCDLTKTLPLRFRITFEAIAFLIAGFVFIAHANGNLLYNDLHFIMFPAFVITGFLHFLCEESSTRSLWVLRSLWISMTGGWLCNIGFGFFGYPGCIGYYGDSKAPIADHMVMGTVSAQIAYQFILWIIVYTAAYVSAKKMGYDTDFLNKEFLDVFDYLDITYYDKVMLILLLLFCILYMTHQIIYILIT